MKWVFSTLAIFVASYKAVAQDIDKDLRQHWQMEIELVNGNQHVTDTMILIPASKGNEQVPKRIWRWDSTRGSFLRYYFYNNGGTYCGPASAFREKWKLQNGRSLLRIRSQKPGGRSLCLGRNCIYLTEIRKGKYKVVADYQSGKLNKLILTRVKGNYNSHRYHFGLATFKMRKIFE